MVTRLVAVDITSYKAVLGNVLILSVGLFRKIVVEELVEISDKPFLTAHEFHHAIDILGSVETEIQRVALDETFSHRLHDVEIFLECPVGVLGAAES